MADIFLVWRKRGGKVRFSWPDFEWRQQTVINYNLTNPNTAPVCFYIISRTNLAFGLVLIHVQLEDKRRRLNWHFSYSVTRIGSMWPCVSSVIDHRRRQDLWHTRLSPRVPRVIYIIFVFTTFWRHLRSITKHTQGNIEFIRWIFNLLREWM